VPSVEVEETRLENGWIKWASPDVLKPRDLTPTEKIALEKKDRLLTEQAEVRDPTCWKCGRPAYIWVREVCFDFKGDRAAAVQHAAISSANYPGPVPGFCRLCVATAPTELAEAVYYDRAEMYWGVRPTRWFVVFTDGTKIGNSCLLIDPEQVMPRILEEHLGSKEED